ncbi:DUF1631 family protein, partial [Burkholderia sola]|uniref:DUF1631 family protein n=1 Tax=Burkholderia sola TaxID=2843302 RepID=UPI00338D51B3
QLVVQDPRFFEDRSHPARQLLDELTARSLWFDSESALGYGQFLQVAESAALRLVALQRADASAFATVLQQLRDAGNTIVVIEHNLDVIKTADWIIDMGPEGGAGGGQVVAIGTP